MKSRILYIGNLRDGGNGEDRVNILRDHNFSVEKFDTFPYRAAGPRIVRSMTSRFNIGPQVTRLNRDLRDKADAGGFDIIFMDKGNIVYRDTLLALKNSATAHIAIHYTPDAALLDNHSLEFVRAIPDYDLLVTTKPFEVEPYRRAGARELLLIEQGYGPRIDPVYAGDVPDHLRSEVAFVGHCQPHYLRTLRVAAEVVPLAIWGPGWLEQVRRHPWLQNVVRGPALFGPDYARAIGGAKIAIGLLSKRIPETTTTRSFEIPAMGTMLLAERTEDHIRLFEEDVEAVFFNDPNEMAIKLRHYLANNEARANIANAGQRKCHSAGYSTAKQFSSIINWLEQALNTST